MEVKSQATGIGEKLRRIARDEDIAVLGTAPASSMAGEPSGRRPQDLVPGARSLLCFGVPVPRDVYLASSHPLETAWRSQNLTYRRLDTLSLRFATLFEEHGARAVPIYGCMPMGLNAKGEVVGYLNQIRMGEVTGIGIMGRNGLLLHARYGARLMLGGVVTTALLPELRIGSFDEPGCPPDCRICVDACPVQAISPEARRVDVMRCLTYTARTPLLPKLRFLILRVVRPEAAGRLMSLTSFDEHTFHRCSRCVALCPYGDAER